MERLEAFFKTGEPIAKCSPFEAPGQCFCPEVELVPTAFAGSGAAVKISERSSPVTCQMSG